MKTETESYTSKMDNLVKDFDKRMSKRQSEFGMMEKKEQQAHEHAIKLQEEQHKKDSADVAKERRMHLKKKLDVKKKKKAKAAPAAEPMSLVQRKRKSLK